MKKNNSKLNDLLHRIFKDGLFLSSSKEDEMLLLDTISQHAIILCSKLITKLSTNRSVKSHNCIILEQF